MNTVNLIASTVCLILAIRAVIRGDTLAACLFCLGAVCGASALT